MYLAPNQQKKYGYVTKETINDMPLGLQELLHVTIGDRKKGHPSTSAIQGQIHEKWMVFLVKRPIADRYRHDVFISSDTFRRSRTGMYTSSDYSFFKTAFELRNSFSIDKSMCNMCLRAKYSILIYQGLFCGCAIPSWESLIRVLWRAIISSFDRIRLIYDPL